MRDVLSRLMRTVPVLGLVAHFFQSTERLRVADEEDRAYRAMMEAMEARPRWLGATRAREGHIIIGQLVGHTGATVLGCGVVLFAHQIALSLVVPATWGLALVLDAAGERLARSIYDRKAEARDGEIADGINEKPK